MNPKSNIELEYKFWVKDKKNLIQSLAHQAKIKKARQYQKTVMFDNELGLMQKTNGRIRVRTFGNSNKKTLTYKRPLPPKNGAKREIEYEISFFDPNEQIEEILKAMGFGPTTSYERYQTEWEMNDVRVTLDEYPFADIIEIEGAKEDIEEVAEKLGFNKTEGLTKPVDTLFQEWRRTKGLPFKPHMRFSDFDK